MGRIDDQQDRQKNGSRRSVAGPLQAAQSTGKTQCKMVSSMSAMARPDPLTPPRRRWSNHCRNLWRYAIGVIGRCVRERGPSGRSLQGLSTRRLDHPGGAGGLAGGGQGGSSGRHGAERQREKHVAEPDRGLDRPTEGDVILDGRSTRGFTESDWTRLRRERIGIVFQFFNLLPGLTARENVALPLLLRGDPDPENRVEECLAAVGLAHRGEHRPSELSGGEQQRVAVARALVHQPALLLADEPTGNLDSKVGREIVQLIKTLARQGGQTVVLATHSRSAAAEADRILLMRDGSVDGEGLAE